MFALFLDEDSLARSLLRGLRSSGLDVLTVLEADRRELSDEEQLAFAAARQRAIYTSNVEHFARLHRDWLVSGRHHAGIIVLAEQRTLVGVQIRALARICQELDPSEMEDRLEFLSNWEQPL